MDDIDHGRLTSYGDPKDQTSLLRRRQHTLQWLSGTLSPTVIRAVHQIIEGNCVDDVLDRFPPEVLRIIQALREPDISASLEIPADFRTYATVIGSTMRVSPGASWDIPEDFLPEYAKEMRIFALLQWYALQDAISMLHSQWAYLEIRQSGDRTPYIQHNSTSIESLLHISLFALHLHRLGISPKQMPRKDLESSGCRIKHIPVPDIYDMTGDTFIPLLKGIYTLIYDEIEGGRLIPTKDITSTLFGTKEALKEAEHVKGGEQLILV